MRKVCETNKYAARPAQQPHHRRSSVTNEWVHGGPVSRAEMMAFFGLCIAMGIVRQPRSHAYWSDSPFLRNDGIASVMSRDRFDVRGVFMWCILHARWSFTVFSEFCFRRF
jgi:hypothetical protein